MSPTTPWTRPVTMIAAVARNGVIGDGSGMTWLLPKELASFKAETLGAALVMGRRTYDGLPRRLRGRRIFVVTSRRLDAADDVSAAGGPFEAVQAALGTGRPVFVAGGAAIYAACLPLVDRMRITRLDFDGVGGTAFPAFEEDEWSMPETSDPVEDVDATWRIERRRRIAAAKKKAP